MKRFFSIIAVAMALVASSVALSSCKKEEPQATKDALTGTCWTYTLDLEITKVTTDLYFLEDGKVKAISSATLMGQTQTDTTFGTYTYSAPTVTMNMFTVEGTKTNTGTISGTTLTFSDGTVLTKK